MHFVLANWYEMIDAKIGTYYKEGNFGLLRDDWSRKSGYYEYERQLTDYDL